MSLDLPKYTAAKHLASGRVSYYWGLPTWARKVGGAPVESEALGKDLVKAIARAEQLNAALKAWRTGADEAHSATRWGSVDWLRDWFLSTPRVTSRTEGTQRLYLYGMNQICDLRLGTGERVGTFLAKNITPPMADEIYEKLKSNNGEVRKRTASMAVDTARWCWTLAIRRDLLEKNPWKGVDIDRSRKPIAPATRDQLEDFIAAANELGYPSVGLAARITFETAQREVDVLGRLSWSHYKGDTLLIIHNKTHKQVEMPLGDAEGCFYPELKKSLDEAPRRGTLIVMREKPDPRTGQFLPYKPHHFQALFRKIRTAAGLPREFTFLALRHGCLTELGDSGCTDQELMAVSARSRQVLSVYTRDTVAQRAHAHRKRRNFIVGL